MKGTLAAWSSSVVAVLSKLRMVQEDAMHLDSVVFILTV